MPEEETRKSIDPALEENGVIVESDAAREELEQDMSAPQSKEEEEALFETLGVEIPKTTEEDEKLETDTLKKELNLGGIEVIPTEPLGDEDIET